MSQQKEPSALSKALAEVSRALNQALTSVRSWAILLIGIGLLLGIASTAGERLFGHGIPAVAALDPYGLALICAAFYAVTR